MMSGKGVLFCLLILVALKCSVSAFQKLNSIDDLKRVFSDKALPLHSLILLYWFANNVDIDNNNVVHLPFDPNVDFGSHGYENHEKLLEVQSEYKYFTMGNVNRPPGNICPRAFDFPEYVLYPRVIERAYTGRNRDRIVVSVQEQNYGRPIISQVFLTQHFRLEDNRGSGYDPEHTFEISTNLLQQLRLFSFNDSFILLQQLRNQFNNNIVDDQLNNIVNIWGTKQAPLGLLFLIIIPDRSNQVGMYIRSRRWARTLAIQKTDEWQTCELQQTHLDVITGANGKAKILWRNVPTQQIKGGVAVLLFKNQMDVEMITYKQIKSSEGSYDTSVSLTEGLQARLHKTEDNWPWRATIKEEICRGKEFQSPNAVSINGYAQLQLFVRNGIGCLRLYIKEDCKGWKSDFYYSWVGLYTSAGKDTNDYITWQWQWATKFEQGQDSGEYRTFEYCTGTTVVPGLQARFIHTDNNEKARTPVWR